MTRPFPRAWLHWILSAALLLAATPAASAPANQCLPQSCAEGNLNAGEPCRVDSDCDLADPGDGAGSCGVPAPIEPNRVFVVNDTSDSVCGNADPVTCCPPLDPAATGDPCAVTTCTLREAVIAANGTENQVVDPEADPPVHVADVIEICPGTYTLSIAGNDEDAALTGDLDLSDTVAIRAFEDNAAPTDTLIRGGLDRVFHVLPPIPPTTEGGEETRIAVSIGGVTIENGGDPGFDENGGAILNESDLTISVSILRDNEVGDADGGAIHNAATGILSFSGASILDNRSGRNGGGISNEGAFTGATATISGNSAANQGGAVYSFSLTDRPSQLLGVTLTENDAPGGGDGVYNHGTVDADGLVTAGLDFRLSNTLLDGDGCGASPGVFIEDNGGNVESPGATCLKHCDGGLDDGDPCNDDGDCAVDPDPPAGEDGIGVCRFIAPFCVGGADDGQLCDVGFDCEGVCDVLPLACVGGADAGASCAVNSDCEGVCNVTPQVCEGGANQGVACVSDADCPDSTCLVVPSVCLGGANDGEACAANTDCEGVCEDPSSCLAGVSEGEPCSVDSDCGGTCQRGTSQGNVPGGVLLGARDDSVIPLYPLALGEIGRERRGRNPAVDGGVDDFCTLVDERFVFRPQDGFFDGPPDCDSGAFEARRPRAEKVATLVGDDGDGAADPGETIEYTVTLINDEELVAGNVFFDFADSLDIDESTNLITGETTTTTGVITAGNGAGDPGSGIPPDSFVQVQCGELMGDAPETITYQVEIDPDLPAEVGIIQNQGFVTFPDPDVCNDVPDGPAEGAFPGGVATDDPATDALEDRTIVTLANPPQLLACKQDLLQVDRLDDGDFNPGDTIRYSIVVTNEGNRSALGVLFEDTPHRDTTLLVGSVSVTIDDVPAPEAVLRGNTEGDVDVAVDLGTLDERAGTTALIEFDALINDPIPLACTDLFNVGTLTGANFDIFFTDDPDAEEAPPAETRTPVVFSPLADESVRFKVKLDFRKASDDALRLRMKNIPIPGDFQAGDEVIIDIGDLRLSGSLDGKGRAEANDGSRRDRFRLKRRSKTVVDENGESAPVYKLLVKSKHGDFAQDLAAFGLEDRDASKEALPVDTRVRIGQGCLEPDNACVDFRANVVLFYSSKAGKKGKGKSTVLTVPSLDCPLL